MEEENENINYLYYVFFAFLWYFVRRNSGHYNINHAIAEILGAVLLVVVGQTVIWRSRYKMPKVVCNGFNGSILGRPIPIQDNYGFTWAVFNTGECLNPVHLRGKLATLVIPWNQVFQSGTNYISKTFVQKWDFKALPNRVHFYLAKHKDDYNLDLVYFGKYSEQVNFTDNEAVDRELLIKNLNRQINLRDDLLEGRNDELVEMKKFAEEITASKESWWRALIPPKREEREP